MSKVIVRTPQAPAFTQSFEKEPTKYTKYDMWSWDFERFDGLLSSLNLVGSILRTGETGTGNINIRRYFALLETFYMELYPLLYDSQVNTLSKKIEEARDAVLVKPITHATRGKIIEDLRMIDLALRQCRQQAGLGVQQQQRITQEQRLANIFKTKLKKEEVKNVDTETGKPDTGPLKS